MAVGNEESREQLDAVIADFLEAVEAGQSIDPDQWLRRHPQCASQLRHFFDDWQQVQRLSAPLRTVAQPQTPIDLQRALGDFQIIREIGRGGMGIVYEVQQLSLDRRMALKVLPMAAVLDRRQLQRFKHEAQAAAQLNHPNIVAVHSVGCQRGVHYYAMELIEGWSLAEVIHQLHASRCDGRAHPVEAHGELAVSADPREPIPAGPGRADAGPGSGSADSAAPPADSADSVSADTTRTRAASPTATIPTDRDRPVQTTISNDGSTRSREFFQSVAELGVQAAEGLEYAHQRGIIHRDIKPANLLLDADRHLSIADFGLARMETDASMTASGDIVGTLRYMSPEQALGKRTIDHHTDIYSLGVTLYELLVLRPAFPGSDRQTLLRQIAEDQPPPPRRLNRAIPADLETIVLKAIHKGPEDRYATAQEMADDLRRFLADQPIRAKRLTPAERLTRWSVRHKALVAAVVAALTLTTVGLAVATALIEKQRTRATAASADLATALGRERQLRRDAERERRQAEEQRQRALASVALARSHLDSPQAQAAAYTIYRCDGNRKEELTLLPESIIQWDCAPAFRGAQAQVGSVFLWLKDDRPEVIGTVCGRLSVDRVQRLTVHEFHSLALVPLAAQYEGVPVWAPARAGIQLRPIPSAPQPAASAPERLRQMQALAREFTASSEFVFERVDLALKPEPVYRYDRSALGTDPIDGGLFGFFHATDPEVLLMVEARRNGPQRQWYYGLARFSDKPLRALHRGAQVWSGPENPALAWSLSILAHPEYQRQVYIAYLPESIPALHIGSHRRTLAIAHDQLRFALRQAGRPAEAAEAADEALKWWRRLGPSATHSRDQFLDSDSAYTRLVHTLQGQDRTRESEQAIAEAVAMYRQLVIDFPDDYHFHEKLANLYVMLEQWDQAAECFAAAAELAPQPYSRWICSACVVAVRLAEGNNELYQAACADMLEQFGTQEPFFKTWTVAMCLYLPNAVADSDRLVKLAAESLRQTTGTSQRVHAQYVHGAALYRAGRFAEAADRLSDLVTRLEPFEHDSAGYWTTLVRLFLSMAHTQRGALDPARSQLHAAVQWIESTPHRAYTCRGTQLDHFQWYLSMEMKLLRGEAEALLRKQSGEDQ